MTWRTSKRLRTENRTLERRASELEVVNEVLAQAVRNVRRIASWDIRNTWRTNPATILASLDLDLNEINFPSDDNDAELVRRINELQEELRHKLEALLPRVRAVLDEDETT